MKKKKGRFIVIEGVDGSGKATQSKLLVNRIKKAKIPVVYTDFPSYGEPSAYFVEKYLRGEYGGANELGYKLPSLFYALDRYDNAKKIKRWLKQGKTVLANRYMASNLGHQGAKIKDEKKRKEFMKWLHDLEYKVCGIPKPDIAYIFVLPPKSAYQFVAKKDARTYLKGKRRDIHEKDLKHQTGAYAAYKTAAKLFPKEFELIECTKGGQVMTIPEIHEILVNKVNKRFKFKL